MYRDFPNLTQLAIMFAIWYFLFWPMVSNIISNNTPVATSNNIEFKYTLSSDDAYHKFMTDKFDEYCNLLYKRKTYNVIYEEPLKSSKIAEIDKEILAYTIYNFTQQCD